MSESWPKVFSEVLYVGNKNANIAICCLWTQQKVIIEKINSEVLSRVSLIGNLYTSNGLLPMFINILSNPKIRYIIMWGNNLSNSGDTLRHFMDNRDILSPEIHEQLQNILGNENLEIIKKGVLLFDLRNEDFSCVIEKINSLPDLEPFGSPIQIEYKLPSVSSEIVMPSEKTGFIIHEAEISKAWLHLVYKVMRFGVEKYTPYGNSNKLKEILNVTTVIRDPKEEIPQYLGVTKSELEKYYPQVLESKPLAGVAYTYGERLRNYENFDQIAYIINLIKTDNSSKRMYATTWQTHIDSLDNGQDVPCLTSVNCSVQQQKLYLTGYFRSQDIYGAWPKNTFALYKLQQYIAGETNLELGYLTIITHSAHIYEWDWSNSEKKIEDYLRLKRPAAELDIRGYIVVSTDAPFIIAQYFSHEDKLVDLIKGQTARQIGLEIVRRMWTSDIGHSLYIGRELMKAELALQLGQEYIQDKPLKLPK
jgi:thymidylate synthase